MKICVYAFSTTALFFRDLMLLSRQQQDGIDWSAVVPQGHFLPALRPLLPAGKLCYLYDRFQKHYTSVTPDQTQQAMEDGEGIVTALMKDKDGYQHLLKEEQIHRATTIHAIYRQFLEQEKPDYIIFPDLEVVDGFILMNICKSLGIKVLYFTNLRFLGRSMFASDPYETLPPYFGAFEEKDLTLARLVLRRFRERRWLAVGEDYPKIVPPKPSLYRRLVVSSWLTLVRERYHASEETLLMKIARNCLGLTAKLRKKKFDLLQQNLFDKITPDQLPEKFIFYALHYTPESSINGLEPYYTDQLRAIDALLLSLPPGYHLVIKEHPAMRGIRPTRFYHQLKKRPGLIFLDPAISSLDLLHRAGLIVTVTGTIGLEAFLLDKPCLSFGRNFFAHLCQPAAAQSELRRRIAESIATFQPATEAEKEQALARILHCADDFMISDPWFLPVTLAPQNVAVCLDYLHHHIRRLENMPALASDPGARTL